MAYRKKTWREKLADHPTLPKVLKFDPKLPCGKALLKMGAKPGDEAPRRIDLTFDGPAAGCS